VTTEGSVTSWAGACLALTLFKVWFLKQLVLYNYLLLFRFPTPKGKCTGNYFHEKAGGVRGIKPINREAFKTNTLLTFS
jgi:hypothetical protein